MAEGEDVSSSQTTSVIISKEEVQQKLSLAKSEVLIFHDVIENFIKSYLKSKVDKFQAGQLSVYMQDWKAITSDSTVLNTISGDLIDFVMSPPTLNFCPPNSICKKDAQVVDQEISSLIKKGVIVECQHEKRIVYIPNLYSP